MTSESAPPVVFSLFSLHYLLPLGRFEEAIEATKRAIALDPLNTWFQARMLVVLFCAGRYDEAIAMARHTLASGRGGHLEYLAIGLSCLSLGRDSEALEPLEEGVRLAPWHSGLLGFLAGVQAKRGDEERARTTLAAMPGGMAQGMVAYHLVRSEIDSAIDWYERDIEQRHPLAAQFASARFLDKLRASDRWPRLAAMMNLPVATMPISDGPAGDRCSTCARNATHKNG